MRDEGEYGSPGVMGWAGHSPHSFFLTYCWPKNHQSARSIVRIDSCFALQ